MTIFVYAASSIAPADEVKLLSGSGSEADGLASICCGNTVKGSDFYKLPPCKRSTQKSQQLGFISRKHNGVYG